MAASKIQSREPVGRRAAGVVLPAIELDRSSTTPLYEQVRVPFAGAIRSGARPGTRLPSTRLLARMLGVSRNTILTAYEELAAEGLVTGRIGSGMVVADTTRGAVNHADPARLLREAQYPGRMVRFEDPDGALVALIY